MSKITDGILVLIEIGRSVKKMERNELKPCQCGSGVELCRGDDDYYIYCPKCKLKTFSDRVYDNITDNCDRLIDVWNRRANNGRE